MAVVAARGSRTGLDYRSVEEMPQPVNTMVMMAMRLVMMMMTTVMMMMMMMMVMSAKMMNCDRLGPGDYHVQDCGGGPNYAYT